VFVLEVSSQGSEQSCVCVRGIKPGK
jgi:hypothetical protein